MVNRLLLLSKAVAKGLTQKELAKKIGISENALTDKLWGRTCFDTKEIVEICDVLGITDCQEKCNIFLT